MDVRWITPTAVERCLPAAVPALLARDDGFLWVDIPRCDREAAQLLTGPIGTHELAVRDCTEGAPVAKIYSYDDHLFLALHSLRRTADEAFRPLQFNQFIGDRFLVTVHGPVTRDVSYQLGAGETRKLAERIDAGQLHPESPGELAHAVTLGQVRELEGHVESIARRVSDLEGRALRHDIIDADPVLEAMFRLRLDLTTIRATASQGRQVYRRMEGLVDPADEDLRFRAQDLHDHYDRIIGLCDSEKELLQDLLDFYQARLTNDLNILVKRFAALGAIVAFNTLIAGIYGMNFEHMPELEWRWGYPLVLAGMVGASAALAWFFRRHRWL